MLPRAAVAALGLCAGACALETSGLLLTGPGGRVGGASDVGAAGIAAVDAGDAALGPDGSIAHGGAVDTGAIEGSVSTSHPPETGASSIPDGSVPAASSGGVSPQDGAATGADGPATGGAALACGSQLLCALPGQTCCVGTGNNRSGGSGGGSTALTCENGATCSDPTATALHCAATADCVMPEVCCLSQQSSPATSRCSPQCNGSDVQLCDPSAQSSGCAGSGSCSASQARGSGPLPSGLGTCG